MFLYTREDFACKCGCGFAAMDSEIEDRLKSLYRFLEGKTSALTIAIHSGCRCQEWNKKEGGAKKSYHLLGMALDFEVFDWSGKVPNKIIYEQLLPIEGMGTGGFYYTNTYIHLDLRPGLWRGGNRQPHSSEN